MRKEDIVALGISEELADKVLELSTADIDGNYIPKSRFNEVNEELKTMRKSVSDRDKQLEELKKSAGDNEALKEQIATLQKTNKDQADAFTAQIAQIRLDNAIDTALTAAGAKNPKTVRALMDMAKLKLADDGKVSGLDAELAEIQKTDGYLFETKAQTQQLTGFQPGTTTKQSTQQMTRERLGKMTLREQTDFANANPDEYRKLFGGE